MAVGESKSAYEKCRVSLAYISMWGREALVNTA